MLKNIGQPLFFLPLCCANAVQVCGQWGWVTQTGCQSPVNVGPSLLPGVRQTLPSSLSGGSFLSLCATLWSTHLSVSFPTDTCLTSWRSLGFYRRQTPRLLSSSSLGSLLDINQGTEKHCSWAPCLDAWKAGGHEQTQINTWKRTQLQRCLPTRHAAGLSIYAGTTFWGSQIPFFFLFNFEDKRIKIFNYSDWKSKWICKLILPKNPHKI